MFLKFDHLHEKESQILCEKWQMPKIYSSKICSKMRTAMKFHCGPNTTKIHFLVLKCGLQNIVLWLVLKRNLILKEKEKNSENSEIDGTAKDSQPCYTDLRRVLIIYRYACKDLKYITHFIDSFTLKFS